MTKKQFSVTVTDEDFERLQAKLAASESALAAMTANAEIARLDLAAMTEERGRWRDLVAERTAERGAECARAVRLEAALRPFAEYAKFVGPSKDDDTVLAYQGGYYNGSHKVTLGHCRAARAALAETGGGEAAGTERR